MRVRTQNFPNFISLVNDRSMLSAYDQARSYRKKCGRWA